jgi:hypothetical protein
MKCQRQRLPLRVETTVPVVINNFVSLNAMALIASTRVFH